jgi:ubiquinone biosynthesis protein
MREHFGPRATVQRTAEDLVHGLRRLPRLIDSLHLIAERERPQGRARRRPDRPDAAPPVAEAGLRRSHRRPRPDRRHRAWWH